MFAPPALPIFRKAPSSNLEYEQAEHPLHKAAEEGNYLQAVKYEECVNDWDDNRLTPLDIALGRCVSEKHYAPKFKTYDPGFVLLLVKHPRLDPRKSKKNLLRYAIFCEMHDCIKVLVERGMKPNIDDNKIPPVMIALKNHDVHTVSYLLQNGAAINNVKYKKETIPTLLLNYDHFTKIDIWREFLEYGLDVNWRSPKNCTFLHLVRDGPILKLLLEAGASPLLVNNNFESAHDVHFAYKSGSVIKDWEIQQQKKMIAAEMVFKEQNIFTEDMVTFILSFVGLKAYRRSSAEMVTTWMGTTEDVDEIQACPTSFTFPKNTQEIDVEDELDLLDAYYESDSCFEKGKQLRLCSTPRTRTSQRLQRSRSEKARKRFVPTPINSGMRARSHNDKAKFFADDSNGSPFDTSISVAQMFTPQTPPASDSEDGEDYEYPVELNPQKRILSTAPQPLLTLKITPSSSPRMLTTITPSDADSSTFSFPTPNENPHSDENMTPLSSDEEQMVDRSTRFPFPSHSCSRTVTPTMSDEETAEPLRFSFPIGASICDEEILEPCSFSFPTPAKNDMVEPVCSFPTQDLLEPSIHDFSAPRTKNTSEAAIQKESPPISVSQPAITNPTIFVSPPGEEVMKPLTFSFPKVSNKRGVNPGNCLAKEIPDPELLYLQQTFSLSKIEEFDDITE